MVKVVVTVGVGAAQAVQRVGQVHALRRLQHQPALVQPVQHLFTQQHEAFGQQLLAPCRRGGQGQQLAAHDGFTARVALQFARVATQQGVDVDGAQFGQVGRRQQRVERALAGQALLHRGHRWKGRQVGQARQAQLGRRRQGEAGSEQKPECFHHRITLAAWKKIHRCSVLR